MKAQPRFSKGLVAASSNPNKVKELQTVGERFGLEILSPSEAQSRHSLGPLPETEETGSSYRENALLKARACAEWSKLPSLGDDSGLEVAALGNAPGLYSARYGGGNLTADQRIDFLLRELEETSRKNGNTDRSARFYCALVLVIPEDDRIYQADGELSGEVLHSRRGDKGFGYDPIVLIHRLGKTLSEIDFSETCRLGFRAQAAEKLFSELQQKDR